MSIDNPVPMGTPKSIRVLTIGFDTVELEGDEFIFFIDGKSIARVGISGLTDATRSKLLSLRELDLQDDTFKVPETIV